MRATLGLIEHTEQAEVASGLVHPPGQFYIPSRVNGVWTKGPYTYLS
jgi:hypothetical protein